MSGSDAGIETHRFGVWQEDGSIQSARKKSRLLPWKCYHYYIDVSSSIDISWRIDAELTHTRTHTHTDPEATERWCSAVAVVAVLQEHPGILVQFSSSSTVPLISIHRSDRERERGAAHTLGEL
jgi:hypothetical protein